MKKYHDINFKKLKEESGDLYHLPVYTGVQVKEPTEVPFKNTVVVVTPPNYLLTDEDGNSFGVSEEDMPNMYVEAK